MKNMILVPQNPLEQIVIHDVNEFGCCQYLPTVQSRVAICIRRNANGAMQMVQRKWRNANGGLGG